MNICPIALIIIILIVVFNRISVNGQSKWTNTLGKPLILLFVPDIDSTEYIASHYTSIFNALVKYAKTIIGKDNIVVLGGRKSIPLLRRYLPNDILLETDINDFWLRDFTPTRQVLFKFIRHDGQYGEHEQEKLKRFVAGCTRQKFLYESALVADGGNILHNGVDKALLTSLLYEENDNIFSRNEILSQLRQELNLSKVVVVPRELSGEISGHVDLTASFIDQNVLAYSDLRQSGELFAFLSQQFGNEVQLVQLDSVLNKNAGTVKAEGSTACGLHVNMLTTDEFVYMPVFAADPQNRVRGQSVLRDLENLQIVAQNTRKQVVPISIPWSICSLGGNTRCLSWNLNGLMADDLMYAAQIGGCHLVPFKRK